MRRVYLGNPHREGQPSHSLDTRSPNALHAIIHPRSIEPHQKLLPTKSSANELLRDTPSPHIWRCVPGHTRHLRSKMESLPISICRGCRQRLLQRSSQRTFSTSARLAVVPPEAPHFVDVPQPFQPDLAPRLRIKGILPVPREIIPQNRPAKRSPEFLDRLIRDPKVPVDESKLNPTEQYKHQTTQLRKSHLRASLLQLQDRERNRLKRKTAKYNYTVTRQSNARHHPPRRDEQLTSVSIPSALLSNTVSTTPSSTAAEASLIHATKTLNLQSHQSARRANQQDSLHTLYTSARHFILDSAALDAAIKKEFDDNDFGSPNSRERVPNYWESVGAPDGTDAMIMRSYGSPRERVEEQGEAYRRDQERMKRLGEKLSGGKIA